MEEEETQFIVDELGRQNDIKPFPLLVFMLSVPTVAASKASEADEQQQDERTSSLVSAVDSPQEEVQAADYLPGVREDPEVEADDPILEISHPGISHGICIPDLA